MAAPPSRCGDEDNTAEFLLAFCRHAVCLWPLCSQHPSSWRPVHCSRQLIEMLPATTGGAAARRRRPTSQNAAAPLLEPGYRPSKEHVARADKAHRHGLRSGGGGSAGAAGSDPPRGLLRVPQPLVRFPEFSTSAQHFLSCSSSFCGRLVRTCGWVSGSTCSEERSREEQRRRWERQWR